MLKKLTDEEITKLMTELTDEERQEDEERIRRINKHMHDLKR